MTVVDAALLGTVAALAVAMIGMAWRMPRAIKKSADETNARIDAANAKGDDTARYLGDKIDGVSAKGDDTARYLGDKIDTGYAQLNDKIDDTARYLGDKIDGVSAKGDDTARYLGDKIDITNSMLSDIRERVAYMEGRADPPPKAA